MEKFSTTALVKTDPVVLAARQTLKIQPWCPEETKAIKPQETENIFKFS